MAREKITIPPEQAKSVQEVQEQCQRMRNSIITKMTDVLGIMPQVDVPLPEEQNERREASVQELVQLATEYVSNRLKNTILMELAGSPQLSRDTVADTVQRLKGWASAMFPQHVVQKLNPEAIFEQVWDDVINELQAEDNPSTHSPAGNEESSTHAA